MKRTAQRIFLTLSVALYAHTVLRAGVPFQKLNTPLGLDVVELTLRRVARLPKVEAPAALAEMAKVIRRRGVGFRLAQAAEESLRRLGANAEVLAALRGGYRTGEEGDYTAEEAAGLKTAPARGLATAVSAGLLNSRATTRPQLVVPPAAKAAGATGMVNVSVLVDEAGNVVSSKAISGHPLLHRAEEEAALATKLRPLTLNGEPIIMRGILLLKP